jgi:hypothetical protein
MSDDVAPCDANTKLQLMLRMVLLLLLLLPLPLLRTISDARSAVTQFRRLPAATTPRKATTTVGLYAAGRMTGFGRRTDGAMANATGFDIFVLV